MPLYRASVVELRKSLVMVDELKSIGIDFVPVPVMNKEDKAYLVGLVQQRLSLLEKEAENEPDKN